MNGSHLYSLVGHVMLHVVTSTLGCKDTVMNTIFINGVIGWVQFLHRTVKMICESHHQPVHQGSITSGDLLGELGGGSCNILDDFPALANKVYRHKCPAIRTPLTQAIPSAFSLFRTLCEC